MSKQAAHIRRVPVSRAAWRREISTREQFADWRRYRRSGVEQ